MKRYFSRTLLASLLFSLTFSHSVVFAQQPSQQQINNAASAGVRQRYDPNVRLQGRNTINGIQFSGVTGAALGCADVGGKIVKGISNLFPKKTKVDASKVSKFNFNKQQGGASTSVPVSSPKGSNDNFQIIQDQLTKADKREACLNGVAYAVAKGMLGQVTNKVLNWANNGFGGDPLYVPNLDSFLEDLEDRHVKKFLRDIRQESPIFGNAIRSVVTYSVSGIQDGLVDLSMDTPQGRAYDEFQQDFTRGGWEAMLDFENNPLGAFFNATDDLASDIGNEEQNTREELQRNDGFLDMRFCSEYASASNVNLPVCENLQPGQSASNCISQNQLDALANQERECVRWESVTPGSVIASQVSQVTGSAVRQLEQADEINEVLGSFFDQILNNLLSKGLASVGDKRNKSFKFISLGANAVGGGSGQGASATSGINALGFEETGRNNVQDFDISRPQQLRLVLTAQYNYLNRLLDARAALNRVVPTLGALDYCVPGPNPTWQEGLDDSAELYFGRLEEVDEGSSTFGRILQSLPIIGGFFGNSNKGHPIAAVDVAFYDKVSDTPVAISDTVFAERNHSPGATFDDVVARYGEMIGYYEANYTNDTLRNAFMSVDPTNTAYANGFVESVIAETSNLPSYAAGSAELDEYYTASESNTREAIRELETIREEINGIVTAAKARYIAEKAAAGTPVILSCINQAYVIDNSPIVPVTRQEADVTSPFLDRFIDASRYFYDQL